MNRMIKIGPGFVLALSTFLLSSVLGAQTASQPQDQSSLADYARKVHKDTGAAKPKPRVFDNDNLPKDDKLSIVGNKTVADSRPAAADDAAEKPADGASTKAASDNKTNAEAKPAAQDEKSKQAEWKGWQDKVAAQKEQVDLASRELNVTQREYEIRVAAMYADVGNRLRNATQWDKEETSYKQQIADKQKAVDDAKQKLEDLKEEAHKAGVPSSMTD